MIYATFGDYDFGTAFESITVGAATAGLTSTNLNQSAGEFVGKPAKAALISVESYDIHMRFDKGDAASDGHNIEEGTSILVVGYINLKNLQMARVTSDATVKVTYYY